MTVHEWSARDAAVSDLNVVFESERAAAAQARYLDCDIDGQPLRAKVHGRASEGTSWIKATIGEFGPRPWLDRSCCSDDLDMTQRPPGIR
jgi:hypothetical protein